MVLKSISRNSVLLALFAAITTLAIASTYLATKEKIAEQERIAANQALLEIFPQNTHDNNLLEDTLLTQDNHFLSLGQAENIHIVRSKNKIVGFIFPVIAPAAYADKIRLLVGIRLDGSISGVRVLQHRETPGLGDAIEIKKSNWITSFSGKYLGSPVQSKWKVKKDGGSFDQFTGATITPRAVTLAVLNSLLFFKQNKEALIKQAQATTASKHHG